MTLGNVDHGGAPPGVGGGSDGVGGGNPAAAGGPPNAYRGSDGVIYDCPASGCPRDGSPPPSRSEGGIYRASDGRSYPCGSQPVVEDRRQTDKEPGAPADGSYGGNDDGSRGRVQPRPGQTPSTRTPPTRLSGAPSTCPPDGSPPPFEGGSDLPEDYSSQFTPPAVPSPLMSPALLALAALGLFIALR